MASFWLSPTRGSAASLFRMTFALCAVWSALGVLLNVERFYTDDGLLPWSAVQDAPFHWLSLFSLAPHDRALPWFIACTSLLAALGLLLGFGSRCCAVALFVIQLSLQHRNPLINNAGDRLFLMLALFAAFLPLGTKWSVEAWLSPRRNGRSFAIWFQRLIAVQVAFVYLNAFVGKVAQASWRNGTAVLEILASPLSALPVRIDGPLAYALTWSTLVFELSFPWLVWYRRYRPYVLVAGVAFHLGIELSLGVPGFGEVMVAAYACFLSDDEAERFVSALQRPRHWLERHSGWLRF